MTITLRVCDADRKVLDLNFPIEPDYIISYVNIEDAKNLTHVSLNGNRIESLDISENPKLVYLSLLENKLTQDSVDSILGQLVAFDQTKGYVDLSQGENSLPSEEGIISAKILSDRGWKVTLTQK